jgi:hypothetical protein
MEAYYFCKNQFILVMQNVFPNGLIGCLYGAFSAGDNDCRALNYSGLNTEMMRLQLEVAAAGAHGEILLYFSFYGDANFLYCTVSLTDTDHP